MCIDSLQPKDGLWLQQTTLNLLVFFSKFIFTSTIKALINYTYESSLIIPLMKILLWLVNILKISKVNSSSISSSAPLQEWVALTGLGIDALKHPWTRQPMCVFATLFTTPRSLQPTVGRNTIKSASMSKWIYGSSLTIFPKCCRSLTLLKAINTPSNLKWK